MKKLNSILLVDDDPISQYINQTLIKKLKVSSHVQLAMNGAEAIQYLQTDIKKDRHKFPDLILLDLNMPVMDGFEFLRHYHKLFMTDKQEVKIVILTTSADVNDIKKAQGYPSISNYLTKPLTIDKITSIVENFF